MPNEEVAAGTTPDTSAAAPAEEGTTLLTNEAAPAETSEAATQTETKDEKPAAAAPEKYEFKMPDGVTLDEAALADFEPILKEANVPQETAQKFVDLKIKLDAATAAKTQEAWNNQVSEWVNTVKTDPEMGGQNFDATRAAAQSALAKYGTPELKKVLDATGLGNNPEVVRAFARVGKAMAEDKFVKPGAGTADVHPAKILFPNMN